MNPINSHDLGRALTLVELHWVIRTADFIIERMQVGVIEHFRTAHEAMGNAARSDLDEMMSVLHNDPEFALLRTQWQRIVAAEVLAVLRGP
jgi:hypothetical protein